MAVIKNLQGTETSLVHLLRERSARQPDRLAYTFLRDGDVEEAELRFADLDARARAIAAGLQGFGAGSAAGERALLLYPPGLEFVAAFFGCLYAGVIAVPAYPPAPGSRAQQRLRGIARDARPGFVLAASAVASRRLQFLGRIDHQVKIRGIRVELGEIEAALAACPGVREAVAAAREVAPGDLRLVAYVTAGPDGAPEPAALRERLQRELPGAMVPSAFVVLDALPLTPNGKVDRRALPAPEAGARRSAAPPRDEVEQELARIWEELLGVSPVGVDDGFFDLGGHSLLAVRLMGRIERRFGRRLPVSVLLQHPTVERLARALRGPGPAARPPLVAIQPSGPRPPFFCVHPTGGNVLCYHDLARQLGPDQPFYGLQSTAPLPESLEAMAAAGLAAIREVQPSGPYRLGGWSLGGVVAYEMARQLEAAGETVDLLAVLDSALPGGDGDLDEAGELAAFAHDLARLTGAPLPDLPPGLLQGLSLERLLEIDEVRAALPGDLGAEQLAELFAVFRQNLRCLRAYRPGPYGGKITLFRAGETRAAAPWSGLAGRGAEIHAVPGDHYSMLRPPHVRDLGARLAACLA